MKTITFWNQYNLGDCFWQCLYLRKLAQAYPDIRFVFECRTEHIDQLAVMFHDIGTVGFSPLRPGNVSSEGAVACWIGHYHAHHPLRNDIIGFLVDWFRHLSEAVGLVSPIHCRQDLLADYPAITYRPVKQSPLPWFDWLVINSCPMSGQFRHDGDAIGHMIRDLINKQYRVAVTQPCGMHEVFCTRDWNMSITEIGYLSLLCRNIIMIATGPMWPTFNIWNQRTFGHRIVLLNDITVDYGEKLPHFGSVQAAHHYLRDQKVI